MARLVEVVDGLGTVIDVPDLLQRIAGSAHDLLDAYAVGVVVREGDRFRAVAGRGRNVVTGLEFPVAGSAVEALVAQGGRSLQAEPERFTHLRQELYKDGPMPLAVALTRADAEGALYVLRAEPLTQDEMEVLEVLAASAGAALRTAEAYARADAERREKDAVIDAMADGLAVLDGTGRVRVWNRGLTAITGVRAEDAIGAELPFPLPDGDVPRDHELPNGRWIEVVVAPVAGTSDRVVDVRDISRPKELENAKDLFLATASHELRTPLTVLRGFGETLLNHWDVLEDGKRREIVGTILSRTRTMTGMVEQLLLGSRAGLGLEVTVRPFDLASAVRAAASAMSGSRPEHPLVVDAPEPVPALGDAASIEAVLGQLVENAAKYSPDGGEITVTVGRDDGHALLQVADTGMGIAEEDLERVFDRFVRTERSQRTRATGSGLGLWIVRRYLEAQDGRVCARRRAGGGTVIEVRLPLQVP
ncbi:MAG: multi-sensor signal transduction histidine kinase [Frankiales bacterium]|jgi:signal transduction histidine kinase|nr:multi-sensor signal transduction histidine kinase [Frankiales bacterium]